MPCPWVPRPGLASRALLPHPRGRPSRHLCPAWQGLAPSCVLAVPLVRGREIGLFGVFMSVTGCPAPLSLYCGCCHRCRVRKSLLGPGALRTERPGPTRRAPEAGGQGFAPQVPLMRKRPAPAGARCGEVGHWLSVRFIGKNGAPAAVTLRSALIQKV